MANFNTSEAAALAVDMVKAALASGELKLVGPHADHDASKRRATADAL